MFRDTEKLVEGCLRRDEKAWEEFIERFSGLLYYSASQRLRRSGMVFNQQDIEDVVQIVLVEIWEKGKLAEVKDQKKINGWLSIVAQTRALNFMRQKREKLLRQDESYRMDDIEVVWDNKQDEHKERLIQKLEKGIEEFDARTKIILKQSFIYGKTHKEIAGFMRLSVNTVSSIIARKKKVLKERMQEF